MKLYGFIFAATMGLSGIAYASQVPATQQPKPAQPQQRATSSEQKEKKKASFLTNTARFALGAGLVGLSIFTGIKAKEEYKEGQTILSKAKKQAEKAKSGFAGLADKADKAVDSLMSSGTTPAPQQAEDGWRSKVSNGIENVRGEGAQILNKVKGSCTNNPSELKTAGWATTSVCSFILGMKLILEAVGFTK